MTIDVLAPRRSRLADELRRELSSSGFVVTSTESAGVDWRADVRLTEGEQARHGVVVHPDERLMTVFTHTGTKQSIHGQFEQAVDPRDRMARRRACLGVVEYLRVLSENDQIAADQVNTRAPALAQAAVPAAPGEHPSAHVPREQFPDTPSFDGERSPPGRSASPGDMDLGPPARSSVQAGALSGGAAVAPPPPVPQLRPRVLPTLPHGVASKTAVAAGDAGAEPGYRRRRWELGVGSALGLEAAPGGPTGHLAFLWLLPIEAHLAICVRALWPVLGVQFRAGGNDVRAWSFGGAFSAQYLFDLGPSRLRPFVGAVLGSRVALTETTPMTAWQSSETFTPSLTAGLELGIRYALAPPVQLFFDAEVGRGWLFPGGRHADYEITAATAVSLHASFGVLFEI